MLARLFILAIIAVVSNAGVDVEDLIERGYTCALADRDVLTESSEPGRRVVCDDGICSECIKTDGVVSLLTKRRDVDVEDYLKDGYVCSEEAQDDPDADRVCDDGVCFGCRKPVLKGGRGDVEDFLESGFKCFLVNGVPKYALADDVEVVCDDGDCFGCIQAKETLPKKKKKSLDEYLDLGYTCAITRKTAEDGDGIVCEEGKCFSCTSDNGPNEEYPVSRRFLDQAEDYLDDGYNCGLTLQLDSPRDDVLCEGDLCLNCWLGSDAEGKGTKVITEVIVERAEDFTKEGYKCAAILSGKKHVQNEKRVKTICGAEVCFICRN